MLIVVLLTRGSKSILFIALLIIKDYRISIVVVLFVALADDLARQARGIGVNCVRWQG